MCIVPELRLAQLAVSPVNSPAWDSGDEACLTHRPPSRRPLFVTALPILHAAQHTQVHAANEVKWWDIPLGPFPALASPLLMNVF